VAAMLAVGLAGEGAAAKVNSLRIGSSGALGGKENKAGTQMLQTFIKEETGLDNKITPQKDWRELARKMAKSELHVGLFQGYEFAWAKEKYAALKPLAVVVNVYLYPTAHVVTNRSNRARDFAGLAGQSLSLLASGEPFLHLYVERQAQLNGGKTPETFFSKIVSSRNLEDALDDVVDGVINAAVADRAGLEGFKRRKPSRFNRLKQVAHSEPFPPPVVACYGLVLDESLRLRFQKGLLEANRKEKGKTMLMLFRITKFDPVPADFDKVLARTRKAYPLSGDKTK
jgi:ABC-type phosphate/phosphonate transport system substrate-binding protein